MGQKIGKGHVVEAAAPFLDLPTAAIDALWRSFNLNTEGWGLDPAAFVRMCAVLRDAAGVKDDDEAEKAFRELFAVFDTDKNDLIDALEFLATIAAVSGMDAPRKTTFIYDLSAPAARGLSGSRGARAAAARRRGDGSRRAGRSVHRATGTGPPRALSLDAGTTSRRRASSCSTRSRSY